MRHSGLYLGAALAVAACAAEAPPMSGGGGSVRGPRTGGGEPTNGMPTSGGMGTPMSMTPTQASPPTFDIGTLTAAETEAYLGKLAPGAVGRVLSPAERQRIAADKGRAIEAIVTAWVKEDGFVEAARLFIQQGLNVSGMVGGVDFELPANLAAHLVRNRRPWSEIITAQTCHDARGEATACDTGAPYGAGLLTTRAFMISRASRFNLTRSSALLKNFACRGYPMEDELQPRIDKDWLIPMFQANTPEEQTVAEARDGFGNGFGCYVCHGQFSLHAQLFVKFDQTGKWQAGADGLQDPKGELGRSAGALMASHLRDPERARSEASQVFGKPVANLAEAAQVMAEAPTFVECAARRFLDHVLGLQSGAIEYDDRIFVDLGRRITARAPRPSLDDIVRTLFTDPFVVRSITRSVTGATR